jgi:hypothetical protein
MRDELARQAPAPLLATSAARCRLGMMMGTRGWKERNLVDFGALRHHAGDANHRHHLPGGGPMRHAASAIPLFIRFVRENQGGWQTSAGIDGRRPRASSRPLTPLRHTACAQPTHETPAKAKQGIRRAQVGEHMRARGDGSFQGRRVVGLGYARQAQRSRQSDELLQALASCSTSASQQAPPTASRLPRAPTCDLAT